MLEEETPQPKPAKKQAQPVANSQRSPIEQSANPPIFKSGGSGKSTSGAVEPEVTIVDSGNGSNSKSVSSVKELRSVIEGLQQQGLLKEAYNQCLENIRNNVDVEFSKEKSQELVELLKKQTKKGNVKTIILFIVILIVSLIISIFANS